MDGIEGDIQAGLEWTSIVGNWHFEAGLFGEVVELDALVDQGGGAGDAGGGIEGEAVHGADSQVICELFDFAGFEIYQGDAHHADGFGASEGIG